MNRNESWEALVITAFGKLGLSSESGFFFLNGRDPKDKKELEEWKTEMHCYGASHLEEAYYIGLKNAIRDSDLKNKTKVRAIMDIQKRLNVVKQQKDAYENGKEAPSMSSRKKYYDNFCVTKEFKRRFASKVQKVIGPSRKKLKSR